MLDELPTIPEHPNENTFTVPIQGTQGESEAAISAAISEISRENLCPKEPTTSELSLEVRSVEIKNKPLPSPVLLINGLQGIATSEEDEEEKTAKKGIDDGFSELQSKLQLDSAVPITYSVTNHTLTIHDPDGEKSFDLNMESSLRRLLEENGSSRSGIDSLHEELNTLNETLKKHIETARPDVIVSSPERVKNSSWSPNGMSMLLSSQPGLRGLFEKEKEKQSFLKPLIKKLDQNGQKIVEENLKRLKEKQEENISSLMKLREDCKKKTEEAGISEESKKSFQNGIKECNEIIEEIKSSDLDLQWHTVLMQVTVPSLKKTGEEIMKEGIPAKIEELLNFSFEQMVASTEAQIPKSILEKIFGSKRKKCILQQEHEAGLRRAVALAVFIEKNDWECGISLINKSGTRLAASPLAKMLYLQAKGEDTKASFSIGEYLLALEDRGRGQLVGG